MLPTPAEPSQPSTFNTPIKRFDWKNRESLTALVRDLMRQSNASYVHTLEYFQTRWSRLQREVEQQYVQEVTAAMALRDCVRFEAYALHESVRLSGSVCCEFMQERYLGYATTTVLSGMRRHARLQENPNRQGDARFSMQIETLIRLYAARREHTRLSHTMRRPSCPGILPPFNIFQSGDPFKQEAQEEQLARLGGLRVPRSFHRSIYQGLVNGSPPALTSYASRYVNHLSGLFGGRAPDNPLVLIWIERADEQGHHAVVCDFSADCPGIFDPHYGFLSANAPSAAGIAVLLAQIAYRYGALSLVALQDVAPLTA